LPSIIELTADSATITPGAPLSMLLGCATVTQVDAAGRLRLRRPPSVETTPRSA